MPASSTSIPLLAPTGSGKTVLFELGIIHIMCQNRINAKQVKCVYIAPTKVFVPPCDISECHN